MDLALIVLAQNNLKKEKKILDLIESWLLLPLEIYYKILIYG